MAPPHIVVPASFVLRDLHDHYGGASILIENISELMPGEVRLRGWVYRLRILGKTAFLILRDCTGEVQCVIASDLQRPLRVSYFYAVHPILSGYRTRAICCQPMFEPMLGL